VHARLRMADGESHPKSEQRGQCERRMDFTPPSVDVVSPFTGHRLTELLVEEALDNNLMTAVLPGAYPGFF